MKITQVQTASQIKQRRSINTSSFGNSNVSFQGFLGTGTLYEGRGTNGEVCSRSLSPGQYPYESYSTTTNIPIGSLDKAYFHHGVEAKRVKIYYADKTEKLPSVAFDADYIIRNNNYNEQEKKIVKEKLYIKKLESDNNVIKKFKEKLAHTEAEIVEYKDILKMLEKTNLAKEKKHFQDEINNKQNEITECKRTIQKTQDSIDKLKIGKNAEQAIETTLNEKKERLSKITKLENLLKSAKELELEFTDTEINNSIQTEQLYKKLEFEKSKIKELDKILNEEKEALDFYNKTIIV